MYEARQNKKKVSRRIEKPNTENVQRVQLRTGRRNVISRKQITGVNTYFALHHLARRTFTREDAKEKLRNRRSSDNRIFKSTIIDDRNNSFNTTIRNSTYSRNGDYFTSNTPYDIITARINGNSTYIVRSETGRKGIMVSTNDQNEVVHYIGCV
ncbi:hypothetical protein B5F25_14550 [Bacteroides sp. An19]|nr:hypothetical protein B5F25_14550 [Bacteroides sp. An19]